MKAPLLILLCALSPLASAKLIPSENVALPDNSQMTFLGTDSENGAYRFMGQVKLRGTLTAGWVTNGDLTAQGMIKHTLELHFFPEVSQVNKLPSLKQDDYETADKRMLVLTNSPQESRVLVNKYFNNVPESFFKYEEGVLNQPVLATLEGYTTYVECDSRNYQAKLIGVEKITGSVGSLVGASGCGTQYAQDVYVTQSKDGYVNLRSQPNAKSDILKQMPNGENLEKIKTSGNWFYVKLSQNPDIIGYVHKSQVIGQN